MRKRHDFAPGLGGSESETIRSFRVRKRHDFAPIVSCLRSGGFGKAFGSFFVNPAVLDRRERRGPLFAVAARSAAGPFDHARELLRSSSPRLELRSVAHELDVLLRQQMLQMLDPPFLGGLGGEAAGGISVALRWWWRRRVVGKVVRAFSEHGDALLPYPPVDAPHQRSEPIRVLLADRPEFGEGGLVLPVLGLKVVLPVFQLHAHAGQLVQLLV
mmetsp:Transcript_7878/g.19556  ORF Transcript_7878/g.19556 Transcript_7878/m.19556 type:complete len:215 (-) Transcript_7878:2055-2699(-)